MNKGPTPRHSKSPKPVTIDLDATDVTPRNEDLGAKPSADEPEAAAPATGATATPAGSPAGAPATARTDEAVKSGIAATPASPAHGAGTTKPDMETKTSGTAASGTTPGFKSKDTEKPKDPEKLKDSDVRQAAAAKPASSGRSGAGLGMVVSGVLGAVIALAGAYALQSGGLLPAPGNSADQVQALSAKLDAASTEVAALKTQMTDAANAPDTDLSAQLSARLDSLETAFNEIAAAGGEAGDAAGLEALQTRLASLEAEIAALGQSSGNATVDPALAAAITELRAAQSGLQAAIEDLRAQAEAASGKIAAIEQGQAKLTEQLGDPGRQIDLARAIAAAGLKSAIDRGGPFMAELEAFASVVPDDPAVPELRDLAARGVPSRSRLIEDFPDAATTAIAAAQPVDPNAGLVDRLMSSAMSVVKVRQVGDVEGDSAEAIAARAETHLLDGNLDAALAEWNALPEASRLAAADFGNALAARARAEMLIAASMAPIEPAAPSQAPAN